MVVVVGILFLLPARPERATRAPAACRATRERSAMCVQSSHTASGPGGPLGAAGARRDAPAARFRYRSLAKVVFCSLVVSFIMKSEYGEHTRPPRSPRRNPPPGDVRPP